MGFDTLKDDAKRSSTLNYKKQTMMEFAAHCSSTERRAEDASRDAIQRLKCNFMKDKEGKTFKGIVSTVTSFGLFVLLIIITAEKNYNISRISRIPTLPCGSAS